MHKLVLIRHGESAWNKENRFTEIEIPATDRMGTGARCVPNWPEPARRSRALGPYSVSSASLTTGAMA